ncbi:TPA: hypothetical protein I7122_18205 [Vibrio vulnificus]|nr:hypothetical protein [Vibrio vulnificus]
MSEPIDKDTLLPDNRTTFERSYEEGSKALVKSEGALSWLNDPQLTRVELLDWMAKELGVLDWFYVDTSQTKRDSVEQAASIQRSAGTRSGLTKALKAIGVDAEIVRGNKPYSIAIKTWAPSVIDESAIRRISSRVTAYKSERDSFELSVGFKSTGQMCIGGVVVSAPRVLVGPWVPPIIDASGAQYVGGAVQSLMRVIVNEYRPD